LVSINEYADRVKSNYLKAKSLLKNSIVKDVKLSIYNPGETWKCLESLFEKSGVINKKILIDISTMPRLVIWNLLHFLSGNGNYIFYRYFSPSNYDSENSLSVDPTTPHLVFKSSGIHHPDRETILIIQTGFDVERVFQLGLLFEPKKIYLGRQSGNQLENESKNIRRHDEELNISCVEYFSLNAFKTDHGYHEIEAVIKKYHEDYNMLMTSFGPKPAAIAMFKLNKKYPEVGLVYVAGKDYSQNYSNGINMESEVSGSLT
jgi:hypothetical protein